MQQVIAEKADEAKLNRRSSILNPAAMATMLNQGPVSGSGGMGGGANVSSGELRDLKLKLARSERENKELK